MADSDTDNIDSEGEVDIPVPAPSRGDRVKPRKKKIAGTVEDKRSISSKVNAEVARAARARKAAEKKADDSDDEPVIVIKSKKKTTRLGTQVQVGDLTSTPESVELLSRIAKLEEYYTRQEQKQKEKEAVKKTVKALRSREIEAAALEPPAPARAAEPAVSKPVDTREITKRKILNF